MNKNYTLEELESYLNGELTEEETNQLNKELAEDESLRRELEALKMTREAIEWATWKSLIQKNQQEFLEERSGEHSILANSTPGIGIWIGRIAASFTLILAGLISVLFITTTPESITSKQVEYVIPVMRSGEFELNALEEAYQKKDFVAINRLGSSINFYDSKAYFILAMAYLDQGQPENAANFLLKIEEENQRTQNDEYADQIDYYLLKAYLDQKKISEAKDRMKKILRDPKHTYHLNFTSWDRLKMTFLDWKY